jgi:uncharacterized phage protein (TIGR02218 family)
MTVSAEYTAQEVATERKPAELYHIWTIYNDWYYTNIDTPIEYGGNIYVPAVLVRGSLEKDSQLNATKLTVSFAYLQKPAVDYIAQSSVDLTWISIMRVFQDQDPIEASVIFIGHIRDITFQGQQGQVTCVGFEYYLTQPLPKYRYQPQCNWKLFDARCTLIKLDASVYYPVKSISGDKLSFEVGKDMNYDPQVYFGGEVWRTTLVDGISQTEKRMISWALINTFGIRFKFRDLVVGDSLLVFPGCDGTIGRCITTYNNIDNFGGFSTIPLDNPVTWVW